MKEREDAVEEMYKKYTSKLPSNEEIIIKLLEKQNTILEELLITVQNRR